MKKSNNVIEIISKYSGILLFIFLGMMIIGWKQTFPLTMDFKEDILQVVSPLFWVGFYGAFIGITGVNVAKRNKWVHFLSVILFILLITAPQFLFLSFGSDTGVLANFVDQYQEMANIGLQDQIGNTSYFQWPVSFVVTGFVGDLLGINSYNAVLVTFIVMILAIGAGMYMLLSPGISDKENISRALFWGSASYFMGLFWIHNWQAVPYTFSMALFIPCLALLDFLRERGLKPRILFLLFFIIVIEFHALTGIWILAVTIIAFLIYHFYKPSGDAELKNYSLSFILIMVVSQITIILYKNYQIFHYITFELKHFYTDLIKFSTSDLVFNRSVSSALSGVPLSGVELFLKQLSWIQLSLILFVFITSGIYVFLKKKIRILNFVLVIFGFAYFIFGVYFAVLGIRSVTLIGFGLSAFVLTTISERSKLSRFVFAACVISMVLFPFTIVRSYQNDPSHMTPYDVSVKEFLYRLNFSDSNIYYLLTEHKEIYVSDWKLNEHITPRKIIFRNGLICDGKVIVIDSKRLNYELERISPFPYNNFLNEKQKSSTLYDNGIENMLIIQDCSRLNTKLEGSL